MADAPAPEAPPAAPPAAPPGTPPAPEAPPAAPPGTPPVPYDWKAAGATPEQEALALERGWKNGGDALTSYVNLEKLTGVPADQIVKIPKDNDSAEWDAVHTRLGRPDRSEGYELPVPEGDDGTFATEASKWMHEAGISKSAAHKIAEKWNAHLASDAQVQEEKTVADNTTEVAELKTAWGPDYQSNSEIVDRAAVEFGMSDDELGALKVALGPKGAMEFMYKIGSKIGTEDKELILNPDVTPAFAGMTSEQAKGEITRLQKDKAFGVQFASASDPKGHQEARDKMARLHKIAYPGS